METKQFFLVGRRTRRGTLVMVLRSPPAPILGPWTVTAVVSSN